MYLRAQFNWISSATGVAIFHQCSQFQECPLFFSQTLEQQEDDALKKLGASQHKMVSCRICKGDHWTSKCPYKDSIGTMNMLEEPGSGGELTEYVNAFMVVHVTCAYVSAFSSKCSFTH